jgi:hypothetical protein
MPSGLGPGRFHLHTSTEGERRQPPKENGSNPRSKPPVTKSTPGHRRAGDQSPTFTATRWSPGNAWIYTSVQAANESGTSDIHSSTTTHITTCGSAVPRTINGWCSLCLLLDLIMGLQMYASAPRPTSYLDRCRVGRMLAVYESDWLERIEVTCASGFLGGLLRTPL